jgi:hypothetical protein
MPFGFGRDLHLYIHGSEKWQTLWPNERIAEETGS